MFGNVFPAWTTKVRDLLPIALGGGGLYVATIVTFGFSAETINVGFQPDQPVAYSHKLHAGELGIDCRYCHNTVDRGAKAAIPPTQTCMNCHDKIWTDRATLEPVRQSMETGEPIHWNRVHDLPDYAFFNHSAHVTRGVGCVECHGRVDQMDVVRQVEPLSMGWCLDCHRNPEPRLRPPSEVTNMTWKPEDEKAPGTTWTPEDQKALGAALREARDINPPVTACSACHR